MAAESTAEDAEGAELEKMAPRHVESGTLYLQRTPFIPNPFLHEGREERKPGLGSHSSVFIRVHLWLKSLSLRRGRLCLGYVGLG